jgi:hypothetical protein
MIYKENLFKFGKIKTHFNETYTTNVGCICLVL